MMALQSTHLEQALVPQLTRLPLMSGIDVAVTTPFRILSDEGVRVLQHVLRQLEAFAVVSPRIPCVLRGG